MNGNLSRIAFNVDLDAIEIAGIVRGRFDGADFHFVAVPAFDLDGTVNIVELEVAAGREGIRLIEELIGRREARQREKES